MGDACLLARNEGREVLLSKTTVTRKSVTANNISSLAPADGFSELEKMKAEQSKAEFEQVQRLSAQSDTSDDRRFEKCGVKAFPT